MNISQNCLDIIKKWEGCNLNAYYDCVGVVTIGYGTIRYPDGNKVRIGDRISYDQAEIFLKFECDKVVESIQDYLTGITLNQNQFDAIVSLCYNIGIGAFAESTVLRELKSGNYDAAANAFMLWVKGTVDGVLVTIEGLVNRRKDEKALFQRSGENGNPIVIEKSPQEKVTWLEGYREANSDNTIIVAWEESNLIEILVLKSLIKEDLFTTLRQYINAKNFVIAPPGKLVPPGQRIEVSGQGKEISKISNPPVLDRRLLIIGVRDDDSGVTGSDVKEMQQRLTDLGYYKGKNNGIFDRETNDAVKAFQADHFGITEADGKVGPLTWKKLWGEESNSRSGGGTFRSGITYLKLTKIGSKDNKGLYNLKLEYIRDGISQGYLETCSGQPSHQFFRKGIDSKSGSNEPLPEGKWYINNIAWADGKDNYYGSVFSNGLGPVSVPLDYVSPNTTERQNIEIHIDWNSETWPGTAGCLGIHSIADYKQFVTWLRDTDPRDLYVDWNLGSVTLP